jgi:hypothetical protein
VLVVTVSVLNFAHRNPRNMPPNLQFPRDRDCYVLVKGDTFPVSISSLMLTQGWQGGQGVGWVDSLKDEFLVSFSDGLFGGFFFWGSNESSDQYTAITGQQPVYGYGVLALGGWVVSTRTYERYTYASRQAGPLVPLVYSPQDRLRFSLRGYFTKEDEWTLSGDPRAPNGWLCGIVSQTPTVDNNHYITLQTTL